MFTFDHGLKAFFLSFRIYDEELTAYCGFYALRCSLNCTKFSFSTITNHYYNKYYTSPTFIKIRRRPLDFYQGTAQNID